MKLRVLFVLCVASVMSEPPPSPQYGPPVPLNSYGAPNYNAIDDHSPHGGHHDHHGDGEPKSYAFGYQVKDDYSGNDYNRQEVSDGNVVKGEYRVLLPDGRTQIVTYYADWQTGFHADVRYEGTAHYPEGNRNNFGYPTNQYGPPPAPAYNNYQGGGPATSSVNIVKDLASPAPYNGGYNNYNNNNGYNYDNPNYNYNGGNFGNRVASPTPSYGAPFHR